MTDSFMINFLFIFLIILGNLRNYFINFSNIFLFTKKKCSYINHFYLHLGYLLKEIKHYYFTKLKNFMYYFFTTLMRKYEKFGNFHVYLHCCLLLSTK